MSKNQSRKEVRRLQNENRRLKRLTETAEVYYYTSPSVPPISWTEVLVFIGFLLLISGYFVR